MDFAISIWNFLWDNQVVIAVLLVFVVWFFVRGTDLLKWVARKIRK